MNTSLRTRFVKHCGRNHNCLLGDKGTGESPNQRNHLTTDADETHSGFPRNILKINIYYYCIFSNNNR